MVIDGLVIGLVVVLVGLVRVGAGDVAEDALVKAEVLAKNKIKIIYLIKINNLSAKLAFIRQY
jgi:hypothetical protein